MRKMRVFIWRKVGVWMGIEKGIARAIYGWESADLEWRRGSRWGVKSGLLIRVI